MMAMQAEMIPERPPGYAYHLLRAALELFQKPPAQLDAAELDKAERRAGKSFHIESLVLKSSEAVDAALTPGQLEVALAELRGRYASEAEFLEDLQNNDMDEDAMRQSLQRELLFDAVMQKVGARRAAVNELDVRLFYEMHRERFQLPEKRVARHILITINPEFPENTREAALARIERLAEKLHHKPNRFASSARQHSECPTALEGGKLGTVVRGQLYPELDDALFDMEEGEVSGVVESEVGFHLVLCERIEAGRDMPLSKVRERIVEVLEDRQRRNCQKAWLAELQAAADKED